MVSATSSDRFLVLCVFDLRLQNDFSVVASALLLLALAEVLTAELSVTWRGLTKQDAQQKRTEHASYVRHVKYGGRKADVNWKL